MNSKEAYELLIEKSRNNFGNWVNHSINVGKAASKIAGNIGLDEEKAKVMGYMHDIGRCFGQMKDRHIITGYEYMMSLKEKEIAQICISHGIPLKNLETRSSTEWDGTEEEYKKVEKILKEIKHDEYDELIQFCDQIALYNGILLVERRMLDCALRYRFKNMENVYKNWEAFLKIQNKIEKKLGFSVYRLFPEIEEDIYRPITEALCYKLEE